LLLTKQGTWRKTVTKRDGFPPGDEGQKAAMCQFLEQLAEEAHLGDCLHRVRLLPAASYSDEQWAVLVALVNLLPYAVAELQNQFSRAGVTDHIEVARAAGAALGSLDEPGEMTLLLDYKIRHLLIDEMQDTSIGQYHLLELLIGGWEPGDGRTLFCVGDPMQSIYRFRDADVSRFLLARKKGIGTLKPRSLLLRRNFRSGEHLVHWFNTVFAQVMPLEDDPLTGAISYAESVPVAAHEGGGQYQVYPLFDASPEEEAAACAEVIRQSLASHLDRETTVLVRSRTQLPLLLSELRRLEIQYQAIEIDRLTDLPEIIDITALTRAICHDGDRLAWLALLRGPWIGMTWQDLHALVVNDSHSTVPELMQDPARVRALSAAGRAMITRLIDALAPFRQAAADSSLRDRVERAWFGMDGPVLLQDAGQLQNIYRFLDVIARIEVAGTVPDVAELSSQLDQERVSSRAGNDCRLQIMTMHKAKGLQFDNVVLYGLGRAASGNKKSVLSWLNLPDEAGHNEMIISPVGPRSEVENDPLHRFIEATELEKDRVEMDRLLYVACTRAIHSLYLIGHVAVSGDGESFRPPRAGTLLHRLWPALEPSFEHAFASRQIPGEMSGDGELHLQTPLLKRVSPAGSPPLAPPLPGHKPAADSSVNDEHAVNFYWVGSAARHAGTIVHQYLNVLAAQSKNLKDVNPQSYRKDVLAKARQLGVGDNDAERVCERVEQSLQGILSDEKGRWILQGDGYSELALTGRWRSRTESIVIDRVKIDADGVHWIIDYKTSTHEGGDLTGFLQQEKDRYQPQLERYAGIYAGLVDAPIRVALYFPLLQEFCEIEII
jgi:ATP-dependent helicase/nuclease subunit A